MALWKFMAVIALIHCATASHGRGFVPPNQNQSESEVKLKIISDVITDFETILSSSNYKKHSHRKGEVSQSSNITPSPKCHSEKVLMIEDQLKKLAEELKTLKNNASNADNVSKITALETTINLLKSTFDDLKKDLETANKKYIENIERLTKDLQKSMVKCAVQSVLCGQISFAEGFLIPSSDGFIRDFLLEIIQYGNSGIRGLIALYDGLQNEGIRLRLGFNIFQLPPNQLGKYPDFGVWIVNNFPGFFVTYPNITIEFRTIYCQSLVQNPSSNIESIVAAFLNDESWKTVTSFNQNVTDLCADGHNILITIYVTVIEQIIDRLNIQLILEKGRTNLNNLSNIILQVAVCTRFGSTGELNTNALVTIARYMKMVMDQRSYSSIPSSISSLHQRCRDSLPQFVRTLVFSSAIYLKNILYREYMYADEEVDLLHNTERRSVYTWRPTAIDDASKFKWKAYFKNDDEIILTNAHFNESLFTCDDCIKEADASRRHVFIGSGKGSHSVKNTWNIEVIGNTIFLKNKHYKEYLHPDFYQKKDVQRRHVFTTPHCTEKTDDSAWQVINAITIPM